MVTAKATHSGVFFEESVRFYRQQESIGLLKNEKPTGSVLVFSYFDFLVKNEYQTYTQEKFV
jgi:hypothetical protein